MANCQGKGLTITRPSGEKLRLFTASECSSLGGSFYPTSERAGRGECFGQDGTNFQYACPDTSNGVVSQLALSISGGASEQLPMWFLPAVAASVVGGAYLLMRRR
jgi:hypothetical protein